MKRALEAQHPGGGYLAPYIMLSLQMYIARTAEGYYTKSDNDLVMDLSDETGIDERLIEEAITTAAGLNIINSSLFTKGIITSELIQEAYFAVMERLRRVSIKNAPYIIHKNSSEGFRISSEDYGRMMKNPIQSSEESPDSSETRGQTSEDLHNASEETVHSSEECEDSSEECTCKVEYSNESYSKGRGMIPPSLLSPFEFEELNKAWNTMIQEPKWKDKTPTALRLVSNEIKSHAYPNPFIAIEMIKYTIKGGYDKVFEPKEEHLQRAESNLRSFLKAQKDPSSKFKGEIYDITTPELSGEVSCITIDAAPYAVSVRCSSEVRNWIEEHIDEIQPIYRKYFGNRKLMYTI